jgi:hypothetical protein
MSQQTARREKANISGVFSRVYFSSLAGRWQA